MEESLRIEVPGSSSVSALHTTTPGATRLLVYAPGAGSRLSDPFGAVLARDLPEHGFDVLRFQFPYSEAGRSAPDRPAVLEATWSSAISLVRDRYETVVASGRSMGGRIASQAAAQGAPVDALALFAYPLHPPNQPAKRRDAHLPALSMPVLFCSGTRDSFATVEELQALVATLSSATLHVLEGADHGFSTLKASGRSRDDVWREAVNAFVAFASRPLKR